MLAKLCIVLLLCVVCVLCRRRVLYRQVQQYSLDMQASDEIQGQYLSYARMKEARALPDSDPTRTEKYSYAVAQLKDRNRRAVIFYNDWIARKNQVLANGDYSFLEWLDKLICSEQILNTH